jgi:MFS family permease
MKSIMHTREPDHWPFLCIIGSSLYVSRSAEFGVCALTFSHRLIAGIRVGELFSTHNRASDPDTLSQGTGFCQTFEQFLAVRACFGIAMGGLYGNAAATALEDVPFEARGLVSGMLQQGYAFGYLLAVVFARGLVDTTPHGWRPLFWFGWALPLWHAYVRIFSLFSDSACPPVLLIIFRLCLPETQAFQKRMEMRRQGAGTGIEKTFIQEGKIALRRYWLMLIYLVLLMAGFNFMVRVFMREKECRLTPFDSLMEVKISTQRC